MTTLQLKSWQSSLPHQAGHATSCLQVKAVRISRISWQDQHLWESLFTYITVRQFYENLTDEICCRICPWAALEKSWQNTFAHLAQGISLSQSIPCHSLAWNSPTSITYCNFSRLCGLYTRGVYWLASTPKQAWQIPSILKTEAHSWLQPMLF